MRLIRGSLFIVAVGPLLTGCLATKGSLQRAKEERRLRLDTLGRGNDENRAVEHPQDAFDL